LISVFVKIPEKTITVAGGANKNYGKYEDQAANGARFSFDEKGKQVENYEDHMVVEQCWIDRFRYQQHWNQPLKTVHCRIRHWWKI